MTVEVVVPLVELIAKVVQPPHAALVILEITPKSAVKIVFAPMENMIQVLPA